MFRRLPRLIRVGSQGQSRAGRIGPDLCGDNPGGFRHRPEWTLIFKRLASRLRSEFRLAVFLY